MRASSESSSQGRPKSKSRDSTRLLVIVLILAVTSVTLTAINRSESNAAVSHSLAQDTFSRSVANAWTGAPTAPWAVGTNNTTLTKAFLNVGNGEGNVDLTAGSQGEIMIAGSSARDLDAQIETRVNKLPGGTGVYLSLIARKNVNNQYKGTLRVNSVGGVTALIYRLSNGEVILGKEAQIKIPSFQGTRSLVARFRVTGTTPTQLALTVWPKGQPQPEPQVVVNDSSPLAAAGAFGVAARLSSQSSTSPITASFDNYTATDTAPIIQGPPPSAPAPTTAPSCVGRAVGPQEDLAGVVSKANSGQTLCIGPGRYRLTKPLNPRSGVTLWGLSGAIIDGSKLLVGWRRAESAWYLDGVLPPAYPSAGQCEDNKFNPCLKAEQLFADGVRLKRVMSVQSVKPGYFYQDYAANRIWVGSDPTLETIEMSSTRTAIQSAGDHITIRGLTVQRFASLGQQGAVSADGPSWTILSNQIVDNHAVGLMLNNASSSLVKDNTVARNGQLGIGQHRSRSTVIDSNRIVGNNTEGFWVADWESGGFKATWSSATVSNNTVTGNAGVGIWFDIDCKGALIKGNTIAANLADGIRFEISYDGEITQNVLSANGFGRGRGSGTSIFATAGINLNTSSNVNIHNNTVSENMNGIALQMRNRGSGVYGLWELVRNSVRDNTIVMTSGSLWGQGASGIGQLGGTNYLAGKQNEFYSNDYTLDTSIARRFASNGTYVTYSQWLSANHDTGSTVKYLK